MRRVLILTGVLGGGTALTFAAAALAASLFPNGAMVQSNGFVDQGWVNEKGWIAPDEAPVPVPWVEVEEEIRVGDGDLVDEGKSEP